MLTPENLIKYLVVLGLPLLASIVLTPLFIRCAPKLGLMDVPNERCIHQSPTPLGGGVVVFVAFNAACYIYYQYFIGALGFQLDYGWWLEFLFSSSLLLVLGLVDDHHGLSPLIKLLGQAAAAICLYSLSEYHLNLFNIEFGYWTGLILVVFWTVAIINAFNLIDGLDGLCSGLAMISAIGLASVFVLRGMHGDALVCLALVGACLGFLYHNFYPAKVFLGDTGSMFLGFALASISVYAGGKVSLSILLSAPFFIAGVPVIDTLLAIWRRSVRKELAKRSGSDSTVKVMQADKEHLHHRLLNYGLKQHQIALVLYGVNLVLVSIGILFLVLKELATGFFLITFLITVFILIRYVLPIELWETTRLMAATSTQFKNTRFRIIFYPLFDLLWMACALWLAGYVALQGKSLFQNMREWIIELPLWLMPVFTSLFLSNTYIKIWRNSFFKDYFYLTLAVVVGSVLSLSLVFFLQKYHDFLLINRSLLFALFSLIGIVSIRIPHHVIREFGIANPNPNPNPNPIYRRKVLLYGAGNRGGAYMRERYLNHADELGTISIIGFIDDNPFLRNQYTYGVKVLGDINDLEAILMTHSVDEVVLTTDISQEHLSILKAIIREKKIKLFRWRTCIAEIN